MVWCAKRIVFYYYLYVCSPDDLSTDDSFASIIVKYARFTIFVVWFALSHARRHDFILIFENQYAR